MAQGNHRPRHARNQSRILRMVGSGNTSEDETTATAKRKGSDEETVRYVKRILCASPSQNGGPLTGQQDLESKPLEELLPPLTSSNEADVQLYGLIAVILSNFVQAWYNRITPDQDFVAEVVQIIAHCTRGLEQRLRLVDFEDLLLDELPALVISHVDGESSTTSGTFRLHVKERLTLFSREGCSRRLSRNGAQARHPIDLPFNTSQ